MNGVTLNDVKMGISVCRNVKMANIFYRLELIEAYGTGILKIMESYRESGFTPQIEVSDNAFKVILPNLNADAETDSRKPAVTEKDGDESAVLALLTKQRSITRKEVEKLLKISQTASGRLLRQMTEKGRIVREGRGKNIHYHLIGRH